MMCIPPASVDEWMDMGVMFGVVQTGTTPNQPDGWLLASDGHTYHNGTKTDVFADFVHAGDVVTMELENGVLRYWVNEVPREKATCTHVIYPVQWAMSMFHPQTIVHITND